MSRVYCRREFPTGAPAWSPELSPCDCTVDCQAEPIGCQVCLGLGWVEDSEGVRFACPLGCVLPEREA